MGSRISTITVDCRDAVLLANFWCRVLGWDVVAHNGPDITIAGANAPFRIDFMQVPPSIRRTHNKLHLDLVADDGDQVAELKRLLNQGARAVTLGTGDVTWHVLADPEGNEFCLLRGAPVVTPAALPAPSSTASAEVGPVIVERIVVERLVVEPVIAPALTAEPTAIEPAAVLAGPEPIDPDAVEIDPPAAELIEYLPVVDSAGDVVAEPTADLLDDVRDEARPLVDPEVLDLEPVAEVELSDELQPAVDAIADADADGEAVADAALAVEPEADVEPDVDVEPEVVTAAEADVEPEIVTVVDDEVLSVEAAAEQSPVEELAPTQEPESVEMPEPVPEPEPVSEVELVVEADHIDEAEAEDEDEPVEEAEPEALPEPEPEPEPEPVPELVSAAARPTTDVTAEAGPESELPGLSSELQALLDSIFPAPPPDENLPANATSELREMLRARMNRNA